MFFRIYFLWFQKLAFVSFIGVFTTSAIPRFYGSDLIASVCFPLLIVCGLISAILAVWMMLISSRMKCPLCGELGEFAQFAKHQLGVVCPRCGDVYPKNCLLSMKIVSRPFPE